MLQNQIKTPQECSILLAEDCPDTRDILSQVLVQSGATVTCVGNGKECMEKALTALKEKHPYDLILMDIQMPVMDGLSATRELRQTGYKLPIVAITARATAEDAEESLGAGCNEHICKLSGTKSLIKHVDKYLHKEAPVRAELPILAVIPDFLRENPKCAQAALSSIEHLPDLMRKLQFALRDQNAAQAKAAICDLGALSLYGYSLFSSILSEFQSEIEAGNIGALSPKFQQLERSAMAIIKGTPELRRMAIARSH